MVLLFSGRCFCVQNMGKVCLYNSSIRRYDTSLLYFIVIYISIAIVVLSYDKDTSYVLKHVIKRAQSIRLLNKHLAT